MFDSPINDWAPGRIKLFGWPWHGRLTPAGGGIVTLQLPNGVGVPLEAILDDSESANAGTLQLFQDPRAKATTRSPLELAADQAAGREWRPQVLFSPPACIIYGKNKYRNLTRGDLRWLYHDGERNWIASLNPTMATVRLTPLLPISRKASDDIAQIDAQAVSVDVSSNFVPSGLGNMTAFIDAKIDGQRAIIGRYASLALGDVAGNQRSFSYGQPVEYYEITLVRDAAGVHSATLTLLRSAGEVAGIWTEPTRNVDYKWQYVGLKMNWDRGAPAYTLPAGVVYNWSTNMSLESLGENFQNQPRKLLAFSYQGTGPSNSGSLRDRIVGLWYDGDDVQVATMNIDFSSSISAGDASCSLSGKQEMHLEGGDTLGDGAPNSLVGQSGGINVTQSGQAGGSISVSVTGTIQALVTLSLNGEVFSTSEYRETQRGHTHTEFAYRLSFYSDAHAIVIVEGAPATTWSLETTRSLTVDGDVVDLDTSTAGGSDSSAGGPVLVTIPVGVLTYSNFIAQLSPGAGVPGYALFPVRYCPKIVGLATVKRQAGVALKHWVGAAAHPGGVLPAKRAGAGQLPLTLYGCQNPLTGLALRDQEIPVSFI